MLKDMVVENKKVKLVDRPMGEFSAFLIGGRLYFSEHEELLTDGEVKLVGSRTNIVQISGYNWGVLKTGRNNCMIKSAIVSRSWLERIFISDESFIQLCLTLRLREVKKARFYSKEYGIQDSRFAHFVSGVNLGRGRYVNNRQLIVFYDANMAFVLPLPNSAAGLVSFRKLNIGYKWNIHRVRGYVISQ